ncbi:MAG: hypothetical protein KAI66_05780, partial [Lentisphaeria bacterium]|nr:hypothetical protein [Lentisphaeria bacterium]
ATDAATINLLSAAGSRWQRQYWGASSWSGYVAYLSFFRHVARLPIDYSKWAAHERLAELSWGRWLHKNFAVICHRPTVLAVDEDRRPHCEDGPSHSWPDGIRWHYWHGVRVPAQWIEDKESINVAELLREPNAEKRRAGCEIVGWTDVIAKLNPTTIDRDPNPQVGTLLKADLPDSPGEYFLQVECGTGRKFAIPVPEHKTAIEANAWTYGLTAEEYKLMETRT